MVLVFLLSFLVSIPFLFFICLSLWRNDNVLPNWPIVGMLPSLLLNVHRFPDLCTEILNATGHTFKFRGPWFTRMEFILTCDPTNIQYITKTNSSNYTRGSSDVLGDGLFTAASHSWRIQRKLTLAIMKQKSFRQFSAKLNCEKVVNGLLPLLDNMAQLGQVVDLQDVLQRFTFDCVCTIIFGIDPGFLSIDSPSVPLAEASQFVLEALFRRAATPELWWKLLRWLRMGEERKLAKAWETIDDFIKERISKKRQELKRTTINQEEEGTNLLTFYMGNQVEDELGPLKTDEFLRDATLALFLAGKDANGTALTWFFWLLSKNPSVESKILEEVRTIFTENQSRQRVVFDSEGVGKLVYLHAALCESMRLFPPIPFVPRSPLQPDALPSGAKVEMGTVILYSAYASGRMEQIWGPDCLDFKPERWISEQGTLRYDHYQNYFVFGAGPRNCLGKDLALVQIKAVAAAVFYNFHVDVLPDNDIWPMTSLVLAMKNGLMVRLRKRNA